MKKKKVEIIHTKPRGKGQCSPVQTYGGTPRFVSVFDTVRCIVFVDKTAEKKKKKLQQISCLYYSNIIF